ncbi:hypothetical protein DBV15_00541, partial [Temnothorax longispinosus]
ISKRAPKFVSHRIRYIPAEGIDLEVIYGLGYQTTVSLRRCSPAGYVLAGTSVQNNFRVCIVYRPYFPRTLLIPLYPGASSHDVAKRHSLAVKGVMFNSSSSTMPLKKRDLSPLFLSPAFVYHTRTPTRTRFPYKLFRGLAFKATAHLAAAPRDGMCAETSPRKKSARLLHGVSLLPREKEPCPTGSGIPVSDEKLRK